MSDWRLTNQERYLQAVALRFGTYRAPRPGWDHDHCAFCWAKFQEQGGPGVVREGYATLDARHWICAQCFEDFKVRFAWRLDGDASGVEDPR